MFGKDTKSKEVDSAMAVPTENHSKGSGIKTFLGKDTTFSGKLVSEGNVQIDGSFDGEIRIGDTLIIGRGGKVKARVTAQRVVVHGRIEGEIEASARVELNEGSVLLGGVKTASLVVSENVHFEGTNTMARGENRKPNRK